MGSTKPDLLAVRSALLVGVPALALGVLIGRASSTCPSTRSTSLAPVAPPPPVAPAPAIPPSPTPVPPSAPAPPAWRADGIELHHWTNRDGWALRTYIDVVQLTEAAATSLDGKLSCRIGAERYADASTLGKPTGPIALGEHATWWADFFYWHPLAATPHHCELLLSVSATAGPIEVARWCIHTDGDAVSAERGSCPAVAEAPPR